MKIIIFFIFFYKSIINDIYIDKNCILYDGFKCIVCKNNYGFTNEKNKCIKNRRSMNYKNLFYLFKEVKQYQKINCDIFKIAIYKDLFFNKIKYKKYCALCSKNYIFNIFGTCIKNNDRLLKHCYQKTFFGYCSFCKNKYILKNNKCFRKFN